MNQHTGRRSAVLVLTSATILVAGTLITTSHAEAAPIGATNSDFNGDGYGDLAASGYANGGTVTVLYGTANGLTSAGSQAWTADSPGIPESHDGNDLFGSSLTTGDFNGDGFSDLAAGNSLEDISGHTGAGGVTIIYGSASGLTSAGSQFFSQDTAGIQGGAEQNDQFALSLAAGNLGNGPQDDLVVGVPRETHVNAGINQGVVHIIFGSSSGLTTTGNQLWSQESPGIGDVAEDRDEFGYSLAVADFGQPLKTWPSAFPRRTTSSLGEAARWKATSVPARSMSSMARPPVPPRREAKFGLRIRRTFWTPANPRISSDGRWPLAISAATVKQI